MAILKLVFVMIILMILLVKLCEWGNNPPKISLTHYYCTPNNIRILDQLVFPYVGKVDKATSKFDFLDSSGRSVVFDAELAMWVTKDVPVLRDLKENKDFNCVPINFEEPCP